MMNVYLASPFFNAEQRETMQTVLDTLRRYKLNVYAPYEHSIENAWGLPNPIWGQRVFTEDVKAIDNSESVVVIDWGMDSDTGTAWECGYAYAKQKTVIVICCGNQPAHSLMMLNGCSIFVKLEDFLRDGFAMDVNPSDIEQK